MEQFIQNKFDKRRTRVKFCPCGKDNRDGKFAPYVGFDTKGYCHSCGQTFLPELPGRQNGILPMVSGLYKSIKRPSRSIDFIPKELFKKLLSSGTGLYKSNHFIQWMGNPERGDFAFDAPTLNNLIETYYLGNSTKEKYKGWVFFPYIDINGNVRDIKAMDYNPATGKRIGVKNGDSFDKCRYIGKEILNDPDANTERCFYGEHLLKGNDRTVRIFESEATATYSAPFYPNSICIATGGKNGCKWTERGNLRVLYGRKVILCPDIDAHEEWQHKAEILKGYGIDASVSELIVTNALKYAQQNGISYDDLVRQKYDLRDILKYKRLSDFCSQDLPKDDQVAPLLPIPIVRSIQYKMTASDCLIPEPVMAESWKSEVNEFENYFALAALPAQTIRLNGYSMITDVNRFIESHLATLRTYGGNARFLPYLDRLGELKQFIELNNKMQ